MWDHNTPEWSNQSAQILSLSDYRKKKVADTADKTHDKIDKALDHDIGSLQEILALYSDDIIGRALKEYISTWDFWDSSLSNDMLDLSKNHNNDQVWQFIKMKIRQWSISDDILKGISFCVIIIAWETL